MEKQKTEQIIFAALLAILLVGIAFRAINKISESKKSKADSAREEPQEDERINAITELKAAPDIKYEGTGNDPLKDIFQAYLIKIEEENRKKPVADKPMTPMPQLGIEGLVWNADMPQAIINGKVVKIGDTIEGVKVIGIAKEGIMVEHDGESVFVKK